MSARDYTDLINALLAEGEVRDRDAPHPGIMIWGTLEARVQGADLVILAGLNEGSWPQAAAPDPWLNRSMRKKVGLLLPERQIGLSAHDYQQAVAGKEVWLSRSVRSDDSETVASRWVNRLTNLLDGLPAQGGPDSLAKMTERGNYWLSLAAQMEATAQSKAAERPSPRPPLAARPKGLSVTEIRTLIRDPYAIYAKHVLRLRPLDPLAPTADPRLRGIVVHRIFEQFIRSVINDADALSSVALQKIAAETLAKHAPWPSVQAMWLARIARVSDWFVQSEAQRQSSGQTIALEARGQAILPDKGFRLTGTADRIDRDQHGNIRLYDYKTGTPPSAKEQAAFDKQLMLEAAMVEMGGFEGIDPASVSEATYIGLGNVPQERPAPLDKKPVALVWQEFQQLINAYFDPNTGYTARRMMQRDTIAGDYDQLARFGEWDHTHDPAPEDLT